MLFTYADLQPALNIDLTDPNGQELANSLLQTAQDLISGPKFLTFPIEEAAVTEFRSDGYSLVHLNTMAPVTDLLAATRNTQSATYDTIAAEFVITHGNREVMIDRSIPESFHSLRLTYTTGWTAETLPSELKKALFDIVGLQLLQVANYSSAAPGTESEDDESDTSTTGPLKKVVSLGYTEEFSDAEAQTYWKARTAQLSRSIGDDIPENIKQTILAYRPSYAL